MLVNIEVNNTSITVKRGETILSALQAQGIKIPSLCSMKNFTPTGACRMCVVEIEGRDELVTSCSQPVEEWMKIKTHSPRVVQARKSIVELLLSNHPDDCLYCVRNGNCELQDLAAELDVRERRIIGKKNKYRLDHSSPSIVRDPAKCILCSRCVRVCSEIQSVHALEFLNRGNQTLIGTAYNKDLNFSSCILCGQCILVCPTAALHERDSLPEMKEALNNPSRKVVVQVDPSVSIALAEEFGLKPGKDIHGVLVSALRKMGVAKVFDTSAGADMVTMEMVSELMHAREQGLELPLFASACPAWVKYAEQFWPKLLGQLSGIKSPQQLLGRLIKSPEFTDFNHHNSDVFSVAIGPCTARKFEAQREEMTIKGISDIDLVLTTRELAKLIRLYGIDMENIEPGLPDLPYTTKSSSGKLYALAGGLTEALVRTLHQKLTGKELPGVKIQELRGQKGRKEYQLKVGKEIYSFVAVSGLNNARILIEEMQAGKSSWDFVEIMACPQGCINGGGQPVRAEEGALKARMKVLHEQDEKEMIRQAHKNPVVNELYDFLDAQTDGPASGELFSTRFARRVVLV
jgi:iron-only hydrogenase group A